MAREGEAKGWSGERLEGSWGGIWSRVGSGERRAWRGGSSARAFHPSSVFPTSVLVILPGERSQRGSFRVLAGEALWSCSSKIRVRQQRRGLPGVRVASLGFVTALVLSVRKVLPRPPCAQRRTPALTSGVGLVVHEERNLKFRRYYYLLRLLDSIALLVPPSSPQGRR